MKKLVLAIAMALSFVLPAFTTTAAAAEVANRDLDEAVLYWAKSFTAGISKGFSLASGKTVPAAKQTQTDKLANDFAKKTLLPCLNRNGLTAEWIKCQKDPELRKLNDAALQVKDMQGLQAAMVAGYQMMQKKYPNLLVKMTQDQEYVKGFQELTMKIQQILLSE